MLLLLVQNSIRLLTLQSITKSTALETLNWNQVMTITRILWLISLWGYVRFKVSFTKMTKVKTFHSQTSQVCTKLNKVQNTTTKFSQCTIVKELLSYHHEMLSLRLLQRSRTRGTSLQSRDLWNKILNSLGIIKVKVHTYNLPSNKQNHFISRNSQS